MTGLLDEVKAVLEPFKREAEDWTDDTPASQRTWMLLSDLRAAARLHAQLSTAPETDWQSRAEVAEAKLAAFDSCMCGSPMDSHDIGSGHSPVSMYEYRLDQAEARAETAEAALAKMREALEQIREARMPGAARALAVTALQENPNG